MAGLPPHPYAMPSPPGADQGPSAESHLADRFEFVRTLGRGGMSSVSEVVDRETGERFALKRLALSSSVSRVRFKREFLSIARLRHPALVEVHEFIETPAGPCFTMQLVDGASLAQAMDRPWWELVPILCDVLDAIGYVHGQRIVHRDIKPENVLLPGWLPGAPLEGIPGKLADFGIAKELGQDTVTALTAAGSVIGTVVYMAPEQARGDRVDGRADLYAFGVMLYQAVTKRFPFPADLKHAIQVLVAKETGNLADAREMVPGIDPAMCDLLERLLHPKPSGRPSSAGWVRATLKEIASRAGADRSSTETPASDIGMDDTAVDVPLKGMGVFIKPGLAGRSSEIEVLDDFAAAATNGSARTPLALWVEGPAGIGKTALIEHWCRDRRGRGAVVLRASCEGPGDDSHLLMRRLVRELLAKSASGVLPDTERMRARAVLERYRTVIERVAPGVIHWADICDADGPHAADDCDDDHVEPLAPRAGDVSIEHAHQLRRLFDLILELAGDQQLIFVVEDVQRADASQAELLGRFATYVKMEREGLGRLKPTASRGRLLISGRPVVAEGPARTLRHSLEERRLLAELRVAPLSSEACWEIAAEYAGQLNGARPDWLLSLVHKAGGVPLVLEALLRRRLELGSGDGALVDTGDKRSQKKRASGEVSSEQLSLAATVPDDIEVTLSVDVARVFEAEIDRLGERAKETLRYASILGARFPLSGLTRLSGFDEEDVLRVLDGAIRLGIVSEVEAISGEYCFAQASLQEVLSRNLTPSRLRVLHRRAAEALREVLEELEREATSTEPAALDLAGMAADIAEHFLASDTPQRAVQHLVRAARDCLMRGAHVDSARAFRLALEQGKDSLVDSRFADQFADALCGAGDLKEGLSWYERAIALSAGRDAEARERRARSRLKASHVALRLRELDKASRMGQAALRDLGYRLASNAWARCLLLFEMRIVTHKIRIASRLGFLRERAKPLPVARLWARLTRLSGCRPDLTPLLVDVLSIVGEVELMRVTDIPRVVLSHLQVLKRLLVDRSPTYDPYLAERLAFHAVGSMQVSRAKVSREAADLALEIASRHPDHPATLRVWSRTLIVRLLHGELAAVVAQGEQALPKIERLGVIPSGDALYSSLMEAYLQLGSFDAAKKTVDQMRRTAHHIRDQHLLHVADVCDLGLTLYTDPSEALIPEWDRMIELSREQREEFPAFTLETIRPVVHYIVRGLDAALEVTPAAEEVLFSRRPNIHGNFAQSYIAIYLLEDIQRSGGLRGGGKRAKQAFRRVRRHLRRLKRVARRQPALEPYWLLARAEADVVRGKLDRAARFYQEARETGPARQSKHVINVIDIREAVQQARGGDEEGISRLEEIGERSAANGWKADVRIVRGYLDELSSSETR